MQETAFCGALPSHVRPGWPGISVSPEGDLELRTLPSTGITGVATVPRSFVPMIQPRASSMVSVYQLIYISSPGQVHVNMEIWDVELGPTHTSR